MSVFNLDLESLLPLLETFQQNGSLSTSLPPGALKQKGPSKVKIDLLRGKIVYCHIEDNTGRIYVLDNKKIRSTLFGLGELEWHLDEGTDKLYSLSGSQPPPQMSPGQESIPGQYSPSSFSSPMQYSPAFQPAQRQSASSLIPRLASTPDARILNSLSRYQRRVLVLVDGKRNVKKISEILFPSSQDIRMVWQVLRELESMGLVVVGG